MVDCVDDDGMSMVYYVDDYGMYMFDDVYDDGMSTIGVVDYDGMCMVDDDFDDGMWMVDQLIVCMYRFFACPDKRLGARLRYLCCFCPMFVRFM